MKSLLEYWKALLTASLLFPAMAVIYGMWLLEYERLLIKSYALLLKNDVFGFLLVVFEIIALILTTFIIFGFVTFGVAQITGRRLAAGLRVEFPRVSFPPFRFGRTSSPPPPPPPPPQPPPSSPPSALPGTDFGSLPPPGREIRPVPPTSPPARVFAGLARAEERAPVKVGSSAIAEARGREIAERPGRGPVAVPGEERERRIEPSGVSGVPERTGRTTYEGVGTFRHETGASKEVTTGTSLEELIKAVRTGKMSPQELQKTLYERWKGMGEREVSKEYRKLIKYAHEDRGGKHEINVAINTAYQAARGRDKTSRFG